MQSQIAGFAFSGRKAATRSPILSRESGERGLYDIGMIMHAKRLPRASSNVLRGMKKIG